MSNQLKGVLMAAGSAGLWGLMGIFTRVLSAADYTSLEVAYLRCLLTGIGLLAFHGLLHPQVLRTDRRGAGISLLFGALTYTIGFLSYAFSVQRIPVAMAAVLSFMSPVWVCLIGLVVFKDRIAPRQMAAIALCLLGAVLITNLLGVQDMRFDLLGMVAAVLNGLGVALQLLVPRYFAKCVQRDTMLAYGFLGAAAVLGLFADHGRILRSLSGPGGLTIAANILMLCVFCTLVGNLFVLHSASYIGPAASSTLSALEVVVSTVVGVLLFRETLSPAQLLGGVIIVTASLGMELRKVPETV